MKLSTALHWLCNTLDNHMNAANGRDYDRQIVSVCGTSECVNPQHRDERAIVRERCADRKRTLLSEVVESSSPELLRYIGDLNKQWVETEIQLARDATVHTFIEPMLGEFEMSDFVHMQTMAAMFEPNPANTRHLPNKTRHLPNKTLLRRRVVLPNADDMSCDDAKPTADQSIVDVQACQ